MGRWATWLSPAPKGAHQVRPFNSLSKGICVSHMSLGITAPKPQIDPKIDPSSGCWLKDKVFQFGAPKKKYSNLM